MVEIFAYNFSPKKLELCSKLATEKLPAETFQKVQTHNISKTARPTKFQKVCIHNKNLASLKSPDQHYLVVRL